MAGVLHQPENEGVLKLIVLKSKQRNAKMLRL